MIKRTRGNKTGVIIPLFTRTLHEDGTTSVEPFTPSSDDAVVVTLEAARKYNYTPIIGENCVIFDLSGAEIAGVYSLTVNISRADGSRLRYFTRDALELTELSSESGDDETAEFTVTGVELDAAWFFFAKGDKGDPGRGIVSVEKTATSGLVDTYTITYTDETTSTFSVVNGRDGLNGRGITTIKKISSADLIDTYQIKYTDGTTSLFNVANGAPGRGIVNITKDSTEGLEDTYEITYTDGTNSFFTVTNGEKGAPGAPGNGIAKLEKTATVGLVDTYRITFTNGTIFYFDVTNGADGVSVQSITKTGTEGLVDTYTITLSNGTTQTFTVTNGRDGLQRVELLYDSNIHYKGETTALTYNEVRALVEDTTKFVTLYDGFNLYLPAYDDEGGAVIFSSSYIESGIPQIMRIAINYENQIKAEGAGLEYSSLKTGDLNNEGTPEWPTYPTTKAVNRALSDKANKDGYYEQMVVGGAENLIGEGNTIEENFYSKTYDNTIEDAEATIKSLKGNTIKINQGVEAIARESSTPYIEAVDMGDYFHVRTKVSTYGVSSTEYSYKQGEKYLYFIYAKSDTLTNINVHLNGVGNNVSHNLSKNYRVISYVFTANTSRTGSALNPYTRDLGEWDLLKKGGVINLTDIFGDNVPSSIVDADTFAQYYGYATFDEIPQEYLEYSEGKLESFTASGIKTTEVDGDEHTHNFHVEDIMHNGEKLFPYGLLSAGTAFDEITQTKAIKRVGVVDMGTLVYTYSSGLNRFNTSGTLPTPMKGGYDNSNMISDLYHYSKMPISPQFEDLAMCQYNQRLYFFNGAYTDANTLKQAMQGVMLYYELAEPIEVDLTEYNANFLAYREGKAELIGVSTPMRASVAYGRNYANLVEQSEQKIKELESRSLRNVFLAAGAVYNSTTGYYELNGLTDITEEEMVYIYTNAKDITSGLVGSSGVRKYSTMKFRTNCGRVNYSNWYSTPSYQLNLFSAFNQCTSAEVIVINTSKFLNYISYMAGAFFSCGKLKRVVGYLDVKIITSYDVTFSQCRALEEIYLNGIKANISFAESPNLNKESILYMINNEAATSAITITLHPTAKAMADADSEIQTALSNHPNISLA